MNEIRTVSDWMIKREIALDKLVEATSLDKEVLEAMIEGRYTPSPRQRELFAQALGIDACSIQWVHPDQVDHMYGHGPQFGRSP